MTEAFRYRRRRGSGPDVVADIASTVDFEERREYLLTFPSETSLLLREEIVRLGGEVLGPNTALLGFGNFVGETSVAGVNLRVISTKIGPDGVSRLLEEVSDLAAALIFSSGSPTVFRADGIQSRIPPVPYHQLQLLRKTMLEDQPGWRLQDWLSIIERGPTRRFEQERPVVPIDRVRRLDQRSMQSIFHRLD